jgi:hypothetical protein
MRQETKVSILIAFVIALMMVTGIFGNMIFGTVYETTKHCDAQGYEYKVLHFESGSKSKPIYTLDPAAWTKVKCKGE